ncbi:DUF4192 family protein [Rhodococcus fascians]|nr:DUF4192 family protein [Rhodococcus fascians]MDJ0471677.1 DUF4192 family protein [Rhodococcus fascians]
MTQHRMSLTTAADTLAAIPALLGFTPDNSVVIIALADDGNGSHLVAPTARVDAHQAEAAAGIITDALTRQDTPVTAVILAAIADTTHAGAALLGLDAIRDALAAAGIRTIRALHTYSLTAGTTFTDLDRFTDGTIPDPATTELATARTADGAVIAASRADLEARYAPTTEIPESLALAAAATMGAPISCPSPSTSSPPSSTPAKSPVPTSPPASAWHWRPGTSKSGTRSWPCPFTETPTQPTRSPASPPRCAATPARTLSPSPPTSCTAPATAQQLTQHCRPPSAPPNEPTCRCRA